MQLFKHKAYGGSYHSPFLLEVAHTGTFSGQVASGTLIANTGQTVSCARALSAYCMGNDGLLHLLSSNQIRVEPQGVLVEGASTNLALWCRDLTNVAWTKTSCTASLTATGVDGAANSASVLTATGAAATCNQTITSASATRNLAIYLRRNVGSGTVSIAVDGTTYTDVTSQLSASFVRVSINQAAVTNPVLSIKLATSGDAVDVDLVQCENLGFASSPIPTTTIAVTRPADVVTVANPLGSAQNIVRLGATLNPMTTWGVTGSGGYLIDINPYGGGVNQWTLTTSGGSGILALYQDGTAGNLQRFGGSLSAGPHTFGSFKSSSVACTAEIDGVGFGAAAGSATITGAALTPVHLGNNAGANACWGWLTNVFVDNK